MKGAYIFAGTLIFIFATYKAVDMTRGIRNNNAGNIRKNNGFTWNGEIGEDSKGFVIFDSSVNGLRALMKLVYNYQTNSGMQSISEIINRYAPTNENNTQAYIDHVSELLNVSEFAFYDLRVEDNLINLAKGIVKHENGFVPYSDDKFKKAYAII